MQKVIIEYEDTPNPNTMKFYPIGHSISPGRLLEFANDGHYVNSPLARELLELPFVQGIFYGHDFISVTKKEEDEWSNIKTEILFTILKYENQIIEGTLLEDSNDYEDDEIVEYDEADEATVKEILELLNEDIRPRVAMDGGDIQLKAYKNNIAYLKLRGACASCPSATVTLYHYVREFLVSNIANLVDVESI